MPPARHAVPLVLTFALIAAAPRAAFCQAPAVVDAAEPPPPAPPLTAGAYVPITGAERVHWIVDGTVGPRSLFVVGPLAASWNTAFNTPEEWGRSASGFAKRYAEREVDVAISSTIEAE